MILVTVGTTEFDALTELIDHMSNKIDERIIIQIGNGHYIPKNCEYFRFSDNIEKYYRKARIVITHGGAGTLFKLLAYKKKIIGISNPNRIGLHQNDLLRKLSSKQYIVWTEIENLQNRIQTFIQIKEYKKPGCQIMEVIKKHV